MKKLKNLKSSLKPCLLVLASLTTLSTVASAEAWPRVPNRATETLCANPDFFDSLAVGRMCLDYYRPGRYPGPSGPGSWYRTPHYSTYDSNSEYRYSPDRYFKRGGR